MRPTTPPHVKRLRDEVKRLKAENLQLRYELALERSKPELAERLKPFQTPSPWLGNGIGSVCGGGWHVAGCLCFNRFTQTMDGATAQ